MKLTLIMIGVVALCAEACANNDVRPDSGTDAASIHMVSGTYRERSNSSSRAGDTITVTDDGVVYVPEYWNGNPRLEPRYRGSIQGNRLLIQISGQDGDPSGPDWQPSPTSTASFQILKSSDSKLVLKPLDSNLEVGGQIMTFDKER